MKHLSRFLLICMFPALAGCTSSFFYPMDAWVQNPANQGLEYEDVVLIHKQGLRLHGWWLPAQGPAQGTVYFLHGNGQNISTHLMNVAWLPGQGYQVFLLDYRGYGLSEGKAKLPEVFDDIRLGLDWLHASGRLGEAPLIAFAQSLGATMTVKVLAERENHGKADCVILESVFSSYADIARDVMSQSLLLRPFWWPVAAAMPDSWDAVEHVGKLEGTPLMILHSREDKVIPFQHGEAVFRAAGEPKVFQPLRGPHTAGARNGAVQGRMLEFLERFCPAPGATAKVASGSVNLS